VLKPREIKKMKLEASLGELGLLPRGGKLHPRPPALHWDEYWSPEHFGFQWTESDSLYGPLNQHHDIITPHHKQIQGPSTIRNSRKRPKIAFAKVKEVLFKSKTPRISSHSNLSGV
jgi:hypothetical protein